MTIGHLQDYAVRRMCVGPVHAGCNLRFHTDFDGGGLRIGNLLHDRYAAAPWRMRADDYKRAMDRGDGAAEIRSPIPDAHWDVDLAPAIRRHGRVIAEEQVIDELLADLATAGSAPW